MPSLQVHVDALLVLWTHGVRPWVHANLNMCSLLVAHLFVTVFYPFHDTIACIINGTSVHRCAKLFNLFDQRTNVTDDILQLHYTMQAISGDIARASLAKAQAAAQDFANADWGPKHDITPAVCTH